MTTYTFTNVQANGTIAATFIAWSDLVHHHDQRRRERRHHADSRP